MVERNRDFSSIDELATYLSERKIPLPSSPKELLLEIRRLLWSAKDEGVLATRKDEVAKLLKISDSPVPGRENVGIYGGEKDFKKRGDQARFVRTDGAWFHFTITVGVHGKALTLPAYDFELVFPDQYVTEHHFPRFLRFDLNQPDHKNELRGLRSHMHPGHENLSVPAPMMGPLEILNLFLYGGLVPDRELRRQ